MNDEQIQPGTTEHAIVAAKNQSIDNVKLKFYYQKYKGYYGFKSQSSSQISDRTLLINSLELETRGRALV
jgi:hypothetical protein